MSRRLPVETWMRIVAPLSLLGLWQLLVAVHALDARFFPPPFPIAGTSPGIFASLAAFVTSGLIWSDGWATLSRIIVGFVIGAVPGTLLGLAMGMNRVVRAYFDPVIALLYPIPKIAVLPLIIFIFGIGEASKYVVVAVGVFFLMTINTEAGVRQIDRIYLDVARAYRVRPATLYFRVLLPGALPNIFAGIKLSIGIAIVLAVAAEFTAAKSGLGFRIYNSEQLLDIETLYAALVAVSLLGFILAALLDMAESIALPWRGEARGELRGSQTALDTKERSPG